MTARTDTFYGGTGYGPEGSTDRFLLWGTGSPEGVVTANVGAAYLRLDGGASTSLYVKESGTGNTGWVAYGGGTSGTVTSVGLSMPAEFSVSGSPVTTAGTLTVTKANESANTVYAGPSSGSAAAPTFRSLVGADLPALANPAAVFGSGYDGAVSLNGATAAPSWATKNGSVYTLQRDIYCTNLTLSGTAQIVTQGYRIFCSGTLDLSAAPASAIVVLSSIAGNAASGSSAGGSSPAPPGITVNGTGNAGAGGGGGHVSGGSNGNAPTLSGVYTFATVGAGGGGGNGSAGGGGSGGNTISGDVGWLVDRPVDWITKGATAVTGTPGGGGGGGACGDGATNAGGGGGGGGGGNGILWIAANTINRAASNTNCIDAAGGAGGAGGAGAGAANTGGGGGGGGGAGGLVYLFYENLTGTASQLVRASGGNGGSGGNATTGGTGGAGGGGGASGYILLANYSTGTVTRVAGYLTAGGAGGAPSGTTGGTGGTGTAYTATI